MAAGDQDDHAEIEALRAEVEELRATQEAKSGRRRPRWGRGTGAVVLLVLAGLLLPSAVTAVWAHRLIGNTDRYVQTVAPLADDPAMQAAITNRITTEIDKYVDLKTITSQTITALGQNGPLGGKLADQLQGLAGPIANGVNGFVHDQVAKIVASPQFATAWDQANRVAHKQLVAVLTGKGNDVVSTDNGAVTVDLGAFVAVVKNQLVANGFTLASAIPTVTAQIVLFQSDDLKKAQGAFSTLDTFAWLLPLLVLLLLVGGVLLSPSRRIGVAGAGLAVVIAMVVSLAALSVGRILYLQNIPTDVLPGGAAGSAFDTITRFLKQGLLTLLFLGLVALVVALLAGPSRGATLIRENWVGGLAKSNQWVRSVGVRTEPAAAFVEQYAMVLRIALVVLGVIVLLAWKYPTTVVAIWLTVVVVIGLAVVDFLRAPVSRARSRAA